MAEGRRALSLLGVTMGEAVGAYRPLWLDTTEGPIEARLYAAEEPVAGILWLGEPAGAGDERGLAIVEALLSAGAIAVVPRYRAPGDDPSCVLDGLVSGHVLGELLGGRFVVIGFGRAAALAREVVRVLPDAAGLGLVDPPDGTHAEAAVWRTAEGEVAPGILEWACHTLSARLA